MSSSMTQKAAGPGAGTLTVVRDGFLSARSPPPRYRTTKREGRHLPALPLYACAWRPSGYRSMTCSAPRCLLGPRSIRAFGAPGRRAFPMASCAVSGKLWLT
jgi:hypothetical protein